MSAEENLTRHHLELPPPPRPVANYATSTRAGSLLFTSGHIPGSAEGIRTTGKVGADLTTEEGYHAARRTGLAILATVRSVLGTLDGVEKVVKITGFVNSTDGFTDQPKVLNGCSDLFVEVFGEAGRAARSAVGAASLPGGVAVEIEAVFVVGGSR